MDEGATVGRSLGTAEGITVGGAVGVMEGLAEGTAGVGCKVGGEDGAGDEEFREYDMLLLSVTSPQ